MASKSTKKDLVQHIAKALEVSPVEAERVMLVVMRYVRRQLLEDTSVILPGIGTLAVTETAARLGRMYMRQSHDFVVRSRAFVKCPLPKR